MFNYTSFGEIIGIMEIKNLSKLYERLEMKQYKPNLHGRHASPERRGEDDHTKVGGFAFPEKA